MKVLITTPHIDKDGAVAPGTILDLEDALAAEYLNNKLAEPVKDAEPETATSKTKKETATAQ
jgi:hypothetical protein